MACCIVMNQPPQDVRGADAAENASCAASTGLPPRHPNLQPPGPSGPGGSSSASPAPPSPGPADTVTDHGRSPNAGPDFKEPWSKLLSLAKEKSHARHARSKVEEASSQISASKNDSVKDKQKKIAGSDEPTLKDELSKPTEPGNESTPVGAETLPATSLPVSDEVESEITPLRLREGRTAKVTTQSKRKSRRRASSVEWDYSGSESADTPRVPLKKAKNSKRKKRNASIEMDLADASDSEAEGYEFDAMHECSICNMKFKRPWRLRTHLQQHLQPEIRPFQCDEDGCSKGYFYKNHLERHKSRSHSDLVILAQTMCPSEGCNRIFKSQSGLKRHINKSHSVENLKFQCPHCDKKFSKNRQLRFHIAEHNGDPPLRCEQCNAGVFSDRDLKRHMRTHKQYVCDVSGCDKVFSTYPAFHKHKAEHNKCFQSLECAHCNKVFKKKSDLRNHVLTHLDQRTIYKCTYDSCPRFYYQERNLNSHIRVYHEKTSSFACSWEGCEMQFLSKKALTKHLMIHEKGRAEPKRKEGPKAPRKDKGLPKRAMATKLAGMLVNRGVEKVLLAPDRTVEVLDFREESPDCPTRRNKKLSSRSKMSKSMSSSSASATSGQGSLCSTDSVDIVNENNVVILQDEGALCPLPIGEDDSIISSLTGKVFEVGKGGVLIEVENNSQIIDANNSGPTEGNAHPTEACSLSENCLALPEKEQTLESVDGVSMDLENMPLIFDSIEENISCQQTGSLTEDFSDRTASSEKNKTSEIGDEAASIELRGSSLIAADMADNISDTLDENSLSGETQPCAETCLNSAVILEKDNETNLQSPEENVIMIEINESDNVVKSNVLTLSCEEKGSNGDVIPVERPVTPTTIRNIVKLVSPPFSSQADEIAAVYESGCMLSATLCAETIVDGPHGESEAILLIPGQKLSAGEASSARVVEVLSGDMEVYSVAGKNANEVSFGSSNESTENSPVKRLTLDDPSVASILQPLLQELTHKSNPSSNSVKSASKPAKLVRNPAHYHNVVCKLANFIRANAEIVPLKAGKCKKGRSHRDNLQGPTQEATHSDSSSVSESDGSRSDSGSDDDRNDYNEDDSGSDDNASSDGDGGNEDDEDGDDDDEVDEQPDDDADGEDEDGEENNDNDENGNDGAGNLNGNDDDNNNNDNNEPNSEGSEEPHEPDSTNGHQHINGGSDLGVDRASSPKQNASCEDDVLSTHSDDLVIDIEAYESEKDPAGKASSQEEEQETATNKSPPQCAPSPEKDNSMVIRRSRRLKQLEASKISAENAKLVVRNAFTELMRKKRCFTEADNRIATRCDNELAAGKENETVSAATNTSKKKQQQPPVRTRLKRKNKKGLDVLEDGKNRPQEVNTCESDSSGSDIIQPCKKRRCNIDDDSDSSVPQKIDGNLSSPTNTMVKEESDADLDSSPDRKSPLQMSLKASKINLLASLKSSSLLPNQDRLGSSVKKEDMLLLEPKSEPIISRGCSQLSEIAWIRVLREASKFMKLSLTAAED
ncbi:uncharacterized protein LOC117648600 [Thrips palmi]|uniref:Uncharacterized protein LOC117648600 n=1 Tax=Thrips palmi TaxID=161013 RepID=A0A6P8Z930_THRPL|nr:uncharacterized protein LOC117648600 [Thrips palmi]